jgi:hypothetical protein
MQSITAGPARDTVTGRWLELEPAIILPEQYCPGAHVLRTAEQRLMAAVLEDAIAVVCSQRGSGKTEVAQKLCVRSAEHWFRSEDTSWPFSFLRICEALDLDPDYMRRAVEEAGRHANGGRLAARIRRS